MAGGILAQEIWNAEQALVSLFSPSLRTTPTTMTHMLPQHPDLNLSQSSLQTALHMDPSQGPPPPPQQQPPPAQQTPQSTSSRKRKKAENGDEAPHPAEPRRLRRSHEACARCRSKKIKASPAGRHRRQIPVAPHLRISVTYPLSISAILNIQSVRRAQLLVYHVSKKIDTDRPSS